MPIIGNFWFIDDHQHHNYLSKCSMKIDYLINNEVKMESNKKKKGKNT